MRDNDPSEGIDEAVPANQPSIMVDALSNPTAWAAVLTIAKMPAEAEAELDAVKQEARDKAKAINDRYSAQHREAWNALEAALDLNSDDNHSLCSEHLDHGVAFVSVDKRPTTGDIGGSLGEMLAQALGGRVAASGPLGGMIEIDADTLKGLR